MANEFVELLKAEIAALEASLGSDPRYKKLKHLANALAAYLDEEENEPSPQQAPAAKTTSAPRTRNPRTQEILDMAVSIVKEREVPTPTSVILRELQARNIEVHGQKPLNNLSAMLSYSGLFKSHGVRVGWVVNPEQPSQNNEAVDDTGAAS